MHNVYVVMPLMSICWKTVNVTFHVQEPQPRCVEVQTVALFTKVRSKASSIHLSQNPLRMKILLTRYYGHTGCSDNKKIIILPNDICLVPSSVTWETLIRNYVKISLTLSG